MRVSIVIARREGEDHTGDIVGLWAECVFVYASCYYSRGVTGRLTGRLTSLCLGCKSSMQLAAFALTASAAIELTRPPNLV